jgi:acetyltransferase-like isoleucine patch superfamily enzyme
MSVNRYAQQRFAGTLVKRVLKRIWLDLFWRPYRICLGEETYVRRPMICNEPHRLAIGSRCTIGPGLKVQTLDHWFEQRFDPKVEIGEDTYIGGNCELVSACGIRIGKGCTLSDNIYINDAAHGLDPRDGLMPDRPLVTKGIIQIGDGSFLGRGVTVLPGVTLGMNCVVGSGSVVTRSAPEYCMLAGNPARIVARFDLDTGQWKREARSVTEPFQPPSQV